MRLAEAKDADRLPTFYKRDLCSGKIMLDLT
jgi:hypothetical protein